MTENNKKQYPVDALYVIGVDGGATKTTAWLASLSGEIKRAAITGSSSPTNVGVEKAVGNTALAIKKVLPKQGNILATFLGFPGLEECKQVKQKIRKELLGRKDLSAIFKGKVIIESDQLVAFRAGTREKDGIILIAGTGCVARGWKKGREHKADGWGYLCEHGSAFWIGQKAIQAVFKQIDGRGPKTLITKLVFDKLKIKNKDLLMKKVYYNDVVKAIFSFSVLAGKAGEKKDRVAQEILREAGEGLSLSVITVIKKLGFQKKRFPFVLIGSVLNSSIVLKTIKNRVKKYAPGVKFIQPRKDPAIGAVYLALEELKKKS